MCITSHGVLENGIMSNPKTGVVKAEKAALIPHYRAMQLVKYCYGYGDEQFAGNPKALFPVDLGVMVTSDKVEVTKAHLKAAEANVKTWKKEVTDPELAAKRVARWLAVADLLAEAGATAESVTEACKYAKKVAKWSHVSRHQKAAGIVERLKLPCATVVGEERFEAGKVNKSPASWQTVQSPVQSPVAGFVSVAPEKTETAETATSPNKAHFERLVGMGYSVSEALDLLK